MALLSAYLRRPGPVPQIMGSLIAAALLTACPAEEPNQPPTASDPVASGP